MKLVAVVTTVGTRADAERIARAVVERGLAACAQFAPIESVYVWKGVLQQEAEWRVLLKTIESSYAAVEAAVRALHPYELPAIYALPVTHALEPYADWVAAGSSGN